MSAKRHRSRWGSFCRRDGFGARAPERPRPGAGPCAQARQGDARARIGGRRGQDLCHDPDDHHRRRTDWWALMRRASRLAIGCGRAVVGLVGGVTEGCGGGWRQRGGVPPLRRRRHLRRDRDLPVHAGRRGTDGIVHRDRPGCPAALRCRMPTVGAIASKSTSSRSQSFIHYTPLSRPRHRGLRWAHQPIRQALLPQLLAAVPSAQRRRDQLRRPRQADGCRFSPMLSEDGSDAATVVGVLKCNYPKPKRTR